MLNKYTYSQTPPSLSVSHLLLANSQPSFSSNVVILEPHGKAEASEDSSGDEAETSPDKNGSLNCDKDDKEARKERKRLKRESKEKRREERRKKKLLKNQEVLFKMVEGL